MGDLGKDVDAGTGIMDARPVEAGSADMRMHMGADSSTGADAGADMSTSADTQRGAHPFPFSFNDQQFFAAVSSSAPLTLACGSKSDLSITEHKEPAAIVNNCGTGTTTLTRVRLGGDGGGNGSVREGYRCGGSGTMNIADSWLEAKGEGADHADTIQCYDPNNSPTAVMNITNTTIRAYTTAATAGLFVADSYALDLHITNVLFWGGPYGLRVHTDGRPGSLYMNNVCFYGEGASSHSFGAGPYLLNPFPPTIAEWNNVNWCTIENGELVVHGSLSPP